LEKIANSLLYKELHKGIFSGGKKLFQKLKFWNSFPVTLDNNLKIFYIISDSLRFHKKGPLRRPFFYLWAGSKGWSLPVRTGVLGTCRTGGFLRYQ
jgi:hypothetical protein